MVPVGRTLVKRVFNLLIYLNFRIWGLGDNMSKITFSSNGLTDSRKTAPGRPLKRELTSSEVIEKQKARIELLEGQMELLKKLETTESRLLNTSENLNPNKAYQLI